MNLKEWNREHQWDLESRYPEGMRITSPRGEITEFCLHCWYDRQVNDYWAGRDVTHHDRIEECFTGKCHNCGEEF